MSWSVSAVGKSDAVAKKLAADFDRISVTGPEVEAVAGAKAAVMAALGAQVPPTAVQVTASGSQGTMGQTDGPSRYTNSVKIDVQPFFGFIE